MKLLFTVAAVLLALLLLGQVPGGLCRVLSAGGAVPLAANRGCPNQSAPLEAEKEGKACPGKKDGNGPDRRKTCPA